MPPISPAEEVITMNPPSTVATTGRIKNVSLSPINTAILVSAMKITSPNSIPTMLSVVCIIESSVKCFSIVIC